MLTEFGKVLIFILIAIVFTFVALVAAWIIRPRKPTPEKLLTYECGENPIGSPWIRFNIRFYIIALIFVVFDVEIVFLFPWAVVYQSLGMFAFIEMMVFIGILLVGLAYVWAKGDLEWDRPRPHLPKLDELIVPSKQNSTTVKP
jgi:NADH-quinone oxidoreductase subunit A